MTNEQFREVLETDAQYFIMYNGDAHVDNGWKLSIQGKTIDDAMYLYEKLLPFLLITKASFKFGTARLINCYQEEQRSKLLTIYIPNGVEATSFAELVYLHIKDYEGGDEIDVKESYTRYKNSIFYRNDRDAYGEYIPAKQ